MEWAWSRGRFPALFLAVKMNAMALETSAQRIESPCCPALYALTSGGLESSSVSHANTGITVANALLSMRDHFLAACQAWLGPTCHYLGVWVGVSASSGQCKSTIGHRYGFIRLGPCNTATIGRCCRYWRKKVSYSSCKLASFRRRSGSCRHQLRPEARRMLRFWKWLKRCSHRRV